MKAATKILFISKGEDSASTRYRALQFFPLLQAAGYEASHATVAGSPGTYLRALRLAAAADIVVVLRKTFPGPLLRLLRRVSRKLVFDFDDAIFCNTDGTPSPTRMRRFGAMAAACDQLLAGNRFLADNAVRYNQAVTIVPTCLDIARYAGDYPKSDDSIDLVWIGSRSTRKYLVEALPALRLAAARMPRLRLKIIADFDLPDAGLSTLAIPWSAASETRELGSAHIGIAPMRDDDWSRGKCALKVLQYMATGLPVVSSAAGANAEIVLPEETGYLVGDDEAWAARIAELAGDAALRGRMGTAGRRRAGADYSLEAGFARLAGAFDALS